MINKISETFIPMFDKYRVKNIYELYIVYPSNSPWSIPKKHKIILEVVFLLELNYRNFQKVIRFSIGRQQDLRKVQNKSRPSCLFFYTSFDFGDNINIDDLMQSVEAEISEKRAVASMENNQKAIITRALCNEAKKIISEWYTNCWDFTDFKKWNFKYDGL
jgi:hypothetical protein